MKDDIKNFKCPSCGGGLEFSPGTTAQKCQYCGHELSIPQSEEEIKELDFHEYLNNAMDMEETHEVNLVKCESCGASITFDENITADECPYCGSSLAIKNDSTKQLKPKSLLPFKITNKDGLDLFRTWIKSLWFAPSKLKKFGELTEKLSGIYVPYWTYDSNTTTHYSGQRGDDYYVTEHYTTTVNGRTESRTRQVRKTRWHYVSGVVWNNFDDILVLASRSLPKKYADELEPWDLKNLVSYSSEFLSGFRAESYQVNLEEGMVEAKGIMDNFIHENIRLDIGGDHQRIDSAKTQYDNITFKHILLPIWISAYRFKNKVFRFLINGRTGEVQGERPYSWIKITLTILATIGGIAGIYFYYNQNI